MEGFKLLNVPGTSTSFVPGPPGYSLIPPSSELFPSFMAIYITSPQSLWLLGSWLALVNAFELGFNMVNLSPFVLVAKMCSSHWYRLQTFFNSCNETIWPAKINVLTEEHEAGWEVAPGAWQTFDLPLGWFGRLCMPVLAIQIFDCPANSSLRGSTRMYYQWSMYYRNMQ